MKKNSWYFPCAMAFCALGLLSVSPVQAAADDVSDQDSDGVADAFDLCSDTVLGAAPTMAATKNRFYVTSAGRFVDGRGRISSVDISDAGGCSGQQIVELAGLSSSNLRYGLWGRYLKDWEEFVGAPTDPENDDDLDGVANSLDVCPATVLGILPTIKASKNRFYSSITGDFLDGRGTRSQYTLADAGGCSSQQIIDRLGLSISNERFGLWNYHLADWVASVGVSVSSDEKLDVDDDGIMDDVDVCPGTVLGVTPTEGVAENRFYTLTTGAFVDGFCRISDVTLSDTGGCSTQQIIDVMGLGNDDLQYGLWEDSLQDWVDTLK
ncbi:MAG: thrombospondin type 3 repeat-containing protein [Granulosicoccus sp.]